MAVAHDRPGVYLEQFAPALDTEFRTGVAGFVGPAGAAPASWTFSSWSEVKEAQRGAFGADELLYGALQGFFENGGTRCEVVLYDPAFRGDPLQALDAGVDALAALDDVDLVCAPSLMASSAPLAMAQQLIRSCEQRRSDWFLLLDPPPPAAGVALPTWIAGLLAAPCARPADAALYGPWVVPGGGDFQPPSWPGVPPCGHVAGMFARVDRAVGVHKAPANEEVRGIVRVLGTSAEQVEGANPIRPLPGRGIRVWGARSFDAESFVGVRRLVLTLRRWLVQALAWTVFEPNDFRLWVRVNRELNARLMELFLQGALQGRTPADAFRVQCDDENNPGDVRARGELHVDVEVAPAVPKELITIRVVRSADGVSVT